MTTELEKQFFDTFGIEPKYQDTCTVEEKYWQNEELANEFGTFDQYMNIKCGNQENCTTQCSCAYQKEIYPQITDRHYLELICVLSNYWVETSKRPYLVLLAPNLGELKENVLSACILHKIYKPLYKQVQAIFEVKR